MYWISLLVALFTILKDMKPGCLAGIAKYKLTKNDF
jgi:hypothetical protein